MIELMIVAQLLTEPMVTEVRRYRYYRRMKRVRPSSPTLPFPPLPAPSPVLDVGPKIVRTITIRPTFEELWETRVKGQRHVD